MHPLRDYQIAAVNALRKRIRDRPIIVAPCGSGKTLIAAEVVRLAAERGTRVLWLCHRRELIAQAHDALRARGADGHAVVASVARLRRRDHADRPPAGLVIADEAHLVAAQGWRALVEDYLRDGASLVGLTATPARLDGRPLTPFGALVVAATSRQLIERGFLMEPTVYSHPAPSMDGVSRAARGDYATGEAAARMAPIVGDSVGHWRALAGGDRTVAFAVNVEHSRAIVARFLEAGVAAEHLDGTTPSREREAILGRLARGETRVVSTCLVLLEGWDLPQLGCVLMCRPTLSLTIWIQSTGRVMRPCEGKTRALILDHAGNAHRHGLPTEDHEWTLGGKLRIAAARRLSKACPACYLQVRVDAEVCPGCGHTFEREAIPTEAADGKLEQFVAKPNRRSTYGALVRTASVRGYRIGWAKVRYRDLFGVWPRGMRDIEESYVCASHAPRARTFGYRLLSRCDVCGKA